MSGINSQIKNAFLAGTGLNPVKVNTPQQYSGRQRQWYDPETRRFTQETARYSSDFVVAQVQGLDGGDEDGWGAYRLRFADVVNPSAAIQRHFDDYKQFLFESAKIEYVRPGTKIETMGSTWIVTNPANVSGASGSGICRRCNAVWNHLDYYGNVVSEPIIVENERANANDSDAQNSLLISKGYFNVICQYNEHTRQIDTNTRFILGSAAYRVTGYSDFETEYTGDYTSIRLLYFTARYEEPNFEIDDMVNHVAGGKQFSWEITIAGRTALAVGETAVLEATSVRNGETVESTQKHFISYQWESSDESVITVDVQGNIEAVGEGTATITARLYQNPAIEVSTEITVESAKTGVLFTTTVPDKLGAFESCVLGAAYFEDGDRTGDTVEWSFTGADKSAYTAVTDGNLVTITCYGYSMTPLTVTAAYNGYEVSATFGLEGV